MSNKSVILVVDDSASIRKTASFFLEPHYDVKEAKNGFNALAAVQDYKPDLILLDVVMPEMDGHSTFLAIRQNPKFEDTPIIFLTGKDGPFDMAYAHQMGCDDYLSKPFTEVELLEKVRLHLRR